MSPEQRAAVVAEALTWLRTPYHSHARLKGVGVDCGQILCAVYETAGVVPHIDPGYYPSDWHLHQREERYMEWLDRYCVRLPRTVRPLPADIALFKYGRCYSHGAIVINETTVLHAYLRREVMLSEITEEPLAGHDVMYWTPR